MPTDCSHDKHPDYQHGVDRRAPDVAVMGLEVLVQIGKRRRDEHIDPAHQVVLGNAVFEPGTRKTDGLDRAFVA